MQFSYNWLQDFFEEKLPGAHDVAERLGLHSFELEGIEELENGDFLIDWDVLPNRSSDCLCYEGIAREISAVFEIPYKSYLPEEGDTSYDKDTQTSNKLDFSLDTDLVLRATKRYAENITVGESPDWLRTKLHSIGQKSINNVVDITNYVMFMTGQPVHAFDYDKLAGDEVKNMTIRHAKKDEKVTDLTGAEHVLDETMLVVADAEKALDVAGVKGGNNSGVDADTTRIVLSACNYDAKNIRHTSKKLKLQTDASKRYENEVPLCKADRAMALLAYLMEKETGALVSEEVIDTHPESTEGRTIELSVNKVNTLLGIQITGKEIVDILRRLNQWEVGEIEETFVVNPTFDRPDLVIPEDIIEEIGRIYGLYNIPETPIAEGFDIPSKNTLKQSWYRTSDVLVQLGFYEVYNRSLVRGGVVPLANSLNANADSLRLALLPLLQEKVERNFSHSDTPHFFEIGKVFTGVTNGVVDEHWSFAGVLGRRKIKEKQRNDLFLQTKGVLETVFEALNLKGVEWKEGPNDETVAVLEIQGNILGSVGVNFWELNFEELVNAVDTKVTYVKPSKYPKMDRDISVFVPTETTVQGVRELIESAGAQKCIETELFDVFEDKENNRKSIGFRLVFQCWNETLSDEWTNGEMDKVYKVLSEQPEFEIR